MNLHREDAGHRLLPHVVDEWSDAEPEHVLYEFPTDNDVTIPFTKVTTRDFANAINRAAWLIDQALGKGDGFPTIGYTGPQDLRYFIFIIAAIKAGYKMLYTSLRNSVQGDIAVVEAATCKIWLVPSRGSNVQRLLDHNVPLRLVSIPDLGELLDRQPVPSYAYNKTWETGKRDPCWVLHTSGSTGNPKPVFRFLDSAASIGANNLLPEVNGRPLLLHDYYGTRVYLTFPFFHAAGLANGLLWPLFHGTTVIFGPEKPVALDIMKAVVTWAKPDAVFTAPSLVEEISKDEEFLSILDNVNALAYGGGPVSKEAGRRIWKHTKLRLSIGTTETGWLPCVETDSEDWNYIHLHPNTGFELQDRGAGLYELVAVRKSELEMWQPIFSTFPDLQHYNLKDLFSRHPTKPDLYTYEGRADNVIVLSNGEKVQPHSMELTIGANPLIDSVIVAGQARLQTSAIIQLASGGKPSSQNERDEILDRLWPTIEEVNATAPAHAELHREFIIFTSEDKPFLKASKGTVRRGPSLQLYQPELDTLYIEAESGLNEANGFQLDLSNEGSLKISLRQLLADTAVAPVHDDEDLFAVAGMDSLQVLTLRRSISRSITNVKNSSYEIDQALIYRNPTIALLAQALLELVGTHNEPAGQDSASSTVNTDTSQVLLHKYLYTLPQIQHGLDQTFGFSSETDLVIILTGSTGSLGSYVLDDLLRSDKVREIWCLNRTPDAEQRQLQLNSSRGLKVDFKPDRVQFRHATLSSNRLGLDQIDYDYLIHHATHIIHTQWQVDFNLALSSFEPHIAGVHNLIRLAVDAKTHGNYARICFTSSVGVANNIGPHGSSIPEAPITDLAAAGSGYGESKLVAERLLQEASRNNGIEVVICRVGQIAGPVGKDHQGGAWNKKEWFPSIIDASAFLSLIPDSLGRNDWIDWIPVDCLSSIILEIIGIGAMAALEEHGSRIFHCVNPNRVRWEDTLLPAVQARLSQELSSGRNMRVVGLDEWVDALKKAASKVGRKDEANVSAFKLIAFLASLPQGYARPEFDTVGTKKASKGLKSLPEVGAEWMNIWLDQWGY